MKNIENFLCFNTLTWNNSVYKILMLQNYIKSAYRSMPDFIEKIKSGISNVGYRSKTPEFLGGREGNLDNMVQLAMIY